ncbi:DUF317 domain-containing protein [Streptomyces sp. NPDC002643]
MSEFARHDRVMVSPRHLAGTGERRISDALAPLVRLFGWRHTHDTAADRLALDSPDGSLFIDVEPDRPAGPFWRIAHHAPYWEAQFTRLTPVEAITALTQALPQLTGDTRHAEQIPLTPLTLAQIADLNTWTHTSDEDGAESFVSPDGHCTLRHEPGAEISWQANHSVHDGFNTHWTATFTRDTPPQLVAQFFAHLSSPEPVEREFREIPYLARDMGDALITPVHGAAVNPHVHHTIAQIPHTRQRRR